MLQSAMRKLSFAVAMVSVFTIASAACGTPAAPPEAAVATGHPYRAEIEKFRHDREAKLTSDTGWLTIAGLFFLTKPQTTFGSDPANDIVLPAGTPARAGTFTLERGRVGVKAADGVTFTLEGKPFTSGDLTSDGKGPPDRVALGDVQLWVHQTGERLAIRLRDRNNHLRKDFAGLKWYPVNEAYRVEGTFVPYDAPRTVRIPNLMGDVDTMVSPGHVAFTLNGHKANMAVVTENDTEFFFIFRDMTSGVDTYPAARFLYTARPERGVVTLDFNKAENPPCAFNPYTTCPLPPAENRLPIRVEAGEKMYAAH